MDHYEIPFSCAGLQQVLEGHASQWIVNRQRRPGLRLCVGKMLHGLQDVREMKRRLNSFPFQDAFAIRLAVEVIFRHACDVVNPTISR